MLFRGAGKNEIKAAVDSLQPETEDFPAHTDIFTPDNYRNSLAVIVKGSASVFKGTGENEMLMSILTPGDVFGLPSVFCPGSGFPTTVRARTDCRAVFITREQLEKLFVMLPVSAHNYIETLSEKIYYLNEKIASLSSSCITDRLKLFLENTAERTGTDSFVLPLSFSELASSLSAGRTSLYRSLDELTEKGFIIREGKKITLLRKDF